MICRWRLAGVLLLELDGLVSGNGLPLDEQFDETLVIKPLEDGRVLSKFSFSSWLKNSDPRNPETLTVSEDEAQHYTLFPLALGQILREYAVTELHLSLNAGKWNYESWGHPEESSVRTGAELWAWMGDGGPVPVDSRWRGLQNGLAGLFCASLNSMNEQWTTSPVVAFPPEGALPDWRMPHSMSHASLPSEHVCTENLTPFLKLLPCKSLSGIAKLLNPHKLFDGDWHGMSVHVLWDPQKGVNIKLTFQAVFDLIRTSGRPKRDWSLRSLFDRTVDKSCPAASSSAVTVSLPQNSPYKILPEPEKIKDNTASYDTSDLNDVLDISMDFAENFQYPSEKLIKTDLSVQRSLYGSGQTRGQLGIRLKNFQPEFTEVLYLETMPWLLQFFLHTMTVSVNNQPVGDAIVSNMTYIPSIPHSHAGMLQFVVRLPPASIVDVRIDVVKAFLLYTEHPADAQRGWDIPGAVVIPLDTPSSTEARMVDRKMYTPNLLVDLATPDFSMPYNVIIFTCSLIAFIFGSVFNLLTRKFVVVKI